jgi:hypothetical protein
MRTIAKEIMNSFDAARWLVLLLVTSFVSTQLLCQTVNVTTWHNDNGRTGWNAQESNLNVNNLGTSKFGKICSSAPLDGQVYAQPIVVTQLPIKNVNTGHTTTYPEVVFVATENDSVYAFDPNSLDSHKNCTQIAYTSLLPSGESAVDCSQIGSGRCLTINPTVGILGTPVVDAITNTLYVVTESQSTAPTALAHRLHALDITQSTLPEKVTAVQIGNGAFSNAHIQRPGLLLLNSVVYVGFSMMDGSNCCPNGYVYGFDATNLIPLARPYFPTTIPGSGNGAGVWQGGAGLAAGSDANGGTYLYFATGNGTFDGTTNFGDSFIKLSIDLTTVNGYFTPTGQNFKNDVDFGSGGVVIIPDGTLSCSNCGYLAVSASKDHNIYLIDRTNPPGFASQSVETVAGSTVYHNAPGYYNSNLYYAAVRGTLGLYPLSNTCAKGGTPPICSSTPAATTAVNFAYGTTPSVSSLGTTPGTAIVWAIWNHGDSCNGKLCKRVPPPRPPKSEPAVLYAFQADTLKQLYASNNCSSRDLMGSGIKFSVPTIANGKVYVGTQTELNVFAEYGNNPPTCK